MTVFIKAIACILISVNLSLVLTKNAKEYAHLLTIVTCCVVVICALEFMKPVLNFVDELRIMGDLDPELIGIVIKTVGIGVLTETISLLCADAGFSSLGKVLYILSSSIILWMALPLFESLVSLVEEILAQL